MNGEGYKVDTHERSQGKPTIMIPVTRGQEIGRFIAQPKISAKYHITEVGRYEAYLIAEGGDVALAAEAAKKVLLAES